MKQYVLGVDGGNTKTHYALFDETGTLVSFLHRGTASHEALAGGYDAMERELAESLNLVLTPWGLTVGDLAFAVFGLAGNDTEEQHSCISQRLDRLGLARYRLVNDAFLGIKAGTTRGVGVCSINGTGTVAAALSPSGFMVQVGGHGFVSGDEGGGGFLSDRVMRAVYDARFRCGPATRLTDLLLSDQRVTTVEALFQRWIARKVPVLSASRAAFEAANAGDEVARGLLQAMGRNGAETALGAIRLAEFPHDQPIEVVLAGSLYVKADSPLLVEAFQSTVSACLGDRAQFRVLRQPPVAGAVLWALEGAGFEAPAVLRQRVLATAWPDPA